jgi:hypothetical protein
MLEALQSTARRVLLKVYLSSDHISVATGKTIAVVISKNGGSFANPAAGATNAAEIANGWYYVDLGTSDTGTLGPLIVRGTATSCDDAEIVFEVVKATNRGMAALPDAAANGSGGVPVIGTGSNNFKSDSSANVTFANTSIATVTNLTNLPSIPNNWLTAAGIADNAITAAKIADAAIDTATFAAGTTIPRCTLVDTLTTYTGNTPQTGDSYARIGATGSGLTSLAPASTALSTATWTSARAGYLDNLNVGGAVASHADAAAVDADVLAVKAKTDNLPASPAAVGSAMTLTSAYDAAKTAAQAGDAMTLADGSISDSTFTVPSLSAPATGVVGMLVQLWRRFFKKVVRDTNANTIVTYADDGSTAVTTQSAQSVGNTDTIGPAT